MYLPISEFSSYNFNVTLFRFIWKKLPLKIKKILFARKNIFKKIIQFLRNGIFFQGQFFMKCLIYELHLLREIAYTCLFFFLSFNNVWLLGYIFVRWTVADFSLSTSWRGHSSTRVNRLTRTMHVYIYAISIGTCCIFLLLTISWSTISGLCLALSNVHLCDYVYMVPSSRYPRRWELGPFPRRMCVQCAICSFKKCAKMG